jgi:hypothetical protein
VLNLFEEAKKDFPFLDTEEIEIVQYRGTKYPNRSSFGIEFRLWQDKPVPQYKEIGVNHNDTA